MSQDPLDTLDEQLDQVLEDLLRLDKILNPTLPTTFHDWFDNHRFAIWSIILVGLVSLAVLGSRTEPLEVSNISLDKAPQKAVQYVSEPYVAPSTYSYQEALPILPRISNLKEK